MYAAIWWANQDNLRKKKADIISLLTNKSRDRRWWPTLGHEWAFLRATTDFNCAYHVTRLLSGGVATSVACRPNNERK
jgi:hypothetical protein